MKKTLLLLLFISLLNRTTSQVLKGEVIYNISLNIKIENIDSKIRENKKLKNIDKHTKNNLKIILKNATDIKASLSFNNQGAIYSVIESLDNEANKGVNITKNTAGGKKNFIHQSSLLKLILNRIVMCWESAF